MPFRGILTVLNHKLFVLRLGLVTAVSSLVAIACHFIFKSDWMEVLAFVTGVIGVYLAAIEHIWNWPVGIVNVLLYAWVFFTAKLYADTTLQLVYFVLLIHGWTSWLKGGEGHSKLSIQRLSWSQWSFVLVFIILGTAAYKPVIEHWKGAQPFWDTILTVMSLVGQVLLNRKYLENWMIWIAVNVAYIPLYLQRNLVPTAILYFIFLVLAIVGLIEWNKKLNLSEVSLD